MFARLHLAGLALVLTACAAEIPPTTVIQTRLVVCPVEPLTQNGCPDWPKGAETLRNLVKLNEQQKLVWFQCRKALELAVINDQNCRKKIKQLQPE